MNSQEVQVSMEASKDGVLHTILDQVRGRWSQQMRTGMIDISHYLLCRHIRYTYPYLPASVKVCLGRPSPTAVISARFSTLQGESTRVTLQRYWVLTHSSSTCPISPWWMSIASGWPPLGGQRSARSSQGTASHMAASRSSSKRSDI